MRADLVVGDGRDVGAHGADRERQRGAPLDAQPLDGVRVVARPGLRREGEHARVEATAAAGAGLEQDVREAVRQPPVELVQAQHVAVVELALALGRQAQAVRLGDRPVEVPLDVADGRGREHGLQSVVQVVDDLGAAHVQHELLAGLGARPAGHADGPVGVRPEQVAVRVDHLGLDPDAEVDAQVRHPRPRARSGPSGSLRVLTNQSPSDRSS